MGLFDKLLGKKDKEAEAIKEKQAIEAREKEKLLAELSDMDIVNQSGEIALPRGTFKVVSKNLTGKVVDGDFKDAILMVLNIIQPNKPWLAKEQWFFLFFDNKDKIFFTKNDVTDASGTGGMKTSLGIQGGYLQISLASGKKFHVALLKDAMLDGYLHLFKN